MNTARLRPGDTVEVEIRGRRFGARFGGRYPGWPGRFAIEPLGAGNSHRAATAKQIRRRLERASRRRRSKAA